MMEIQPWDVPFLSQLEPVLAWVAFLLFIVVGSVMWAIDKRKQRQGPQ